MKKTIFAFICVLALLVVPAFSQISKNSFDGRNYSDDQIIKIHSEGYYFTYLGYNAQSTSFSTYGDEVYFSTDTNFKQDIKCYRNGVKIKISDYLYDIGLTDAARNYEKYEKKTKTADAWTLGLGIPGLAATLGGGIAVFCTPENSVGQDVSIGITFGGLALLTSSLIPMMVSQFATEPDLSLDLMSAQTAKKNKELLNF